MGDILGSLPLDCLLISLVASAAGKLRLFGLTAHATIDQIFPVHCDAHIVVVFSGSRHDYLEAIHFLVSYVSIEWR